MKKSKIIIPALGMLILSTAASVTGTVAWFTTVSSATANITSFAVRKLGGDLSYVVAAGTGTEKVDSTDTSSIRLKNSTASKTLVALTDSSYDHTAGVLYRANSNATQFNAVAAESEENWKVTGTDAEGNTLITYYAVTWTYTFKYTFGGDSNPVNLYFDAATSTIDRTQNQAAAQGHTEQTYKGFRIAFVCSEASRAVVWAENEDASNCHYIKSNTTVTYPNGVQTYANRGEYVNADSASAAGDLVKSLVAVDENGSGGVARSDFLGQFTSDDNTLEVKCVAWYEGTDPNVINGAAMDTVAAAMTFYTRPNA